MIGEGVQMPADLEEMLQATRNEEEEEEGEGRRLAASSEFKEWVTYKDKMPAVRNAGFCKASWAMAANTLLEVRTAIKYNIPAVIHMSDQQLIDCVYVDQGYDSCRNSGWTEHAFVYREANGHTFDYEYGLVSNIVGQQLACNYDEVPLHKEGMKPKPYSTPYPNHPYVLKDASIFTLIEMLNTVGPVIVGVNASSMAFKHYSSGILGNGDMDQGKPNHVMVLVGYKAIPNGAHFWIL